MKEFYIKIKEANVQVNEDVYYAYYKQKWHERYEHKKRLSKKLSYECLRDSGVAVELIMVDTSKSLEDEVITEIMVEKLRECLSKLSRDELFLITEIFFKSRSIRDVADMLSIPKSTIQRQKDRILKKLFNYFDKTK